MRWRAVAAQRGGDSSLSDCKGSHKGSGAMDKAERVSPSFVGRRVSLVRGEN